MFTTISQHSAATASSRKLSSLRLTGQFEGLTETLKEEFGVDASQGYAHKRELAELIAAWEESKIQSETKNKVDAVARAHGEPISHVPADWESIMKGFKQKHGANTPEYYFPSQSYFEAFDEKVNEGRLCPETLAQVVSLEEEDALQRTKPEKPKQLHLTLDANLTVQTRRRYLSSVPSSIEELRKKYWVMTRVCGSWPRCVSTQTWMRKRGITFWRSS